MFGNRIALCVQMLAVGSILWGVSAAAQDAPHETAAAPTASTMPTVGAPVRDMSGGEVGTVTAVEGQTALVKTDRFEIRIPIASMAPNQGAYLIAMSRAELNTAAAEALAAINPQPVVQGAGTSDAEGTETGPNQQ